jgi:hypothetical protein
MTVQLPVPSTALGHQYATMNKQVSNLLPLPERALVKEY